MGLLCWDTSVEYKIAYVLFAIFLLVYSLYSSTVPTVITDCSALSSLSVMVGSERLLLVLLHLYEEYISQEWYQPWESFIWIAGEL